MKLLRSLLKWIHRRRLAPAPDGFQWLVFDDARVAFLAPADYSTHREPDQTIAVYPPGDASGITLRFSLQPQPLDPRLPDDGALRFLEAEAARRQQPLSRLGDRLYFTETGTADWPDRQVRIHYWQFATGRILIVASATVWGPDPESAIVQRALGLVPRLLESVRRL
jgi:hypothetical protein